MAMNDTSTTTVEGPVGSRAGWVMLSITRIVIGFYFLWAFIDKAFGLGFSTCRNSAEDGSFTVDVFCDSAWFNGFPRITEGYLVFGGNPQSPFNDFYVDLGGQAWTDWPFMIGLLGIGLALMLGIGTRIGAISATLMLLMMYTTQIPLSTNPFLDDHIIMIVAVIAAVLLEARYQAVGFGQAWKRMGVVEKNRWLI
ncbi:hypothetical protein [uncultured Demequina sp.]|uniref:hypothetical protein n=1 Tax=uncultured Demequina sp. TaxID=693499 RepID=UPI0025EDE09D|nr:hypothetical protein [uncultured Demequina sp.]